MNNYLSYFPVNNASNFDNTPLETDELNELNEIDELIRENRSSS
jgi:hypothetical protein